MHFGFCVHMFDFLVVLLCSMHVISSLGIHKNPKNAVHNILSILKYIVEHLFL